MKARGEERKRTLRRLGITGTIAAFLAAWAIVFGQLVLGHDPALGKSKTSQSQPKATTTQSEGTTSNDTTSGDDGGSSPSSPAPATTSQS